MSTAALFPTRFEFRYSMDEALTRYHARSRQYAGIASSWWSWGRFAVLMFLVSGLALLAQALGAIPQREVPFIAMLFSLAFIAGAYAAWMEAGSMAKRSIMALHAGSAFGPWDVTISDDTLQASAHGYGVRLDLASITDVVVDDVFVVIVIDPTLDFALPKRCLGDDAGVGAFVRFVETRSTAAGPQSQH